MPTGDSAARSIYVNIDNSSAVHAEDVPFTDGDDGVMALAVSSSSTSSRFATTVGDYEPLNLDHSGNLKVLIRSGTTGAAVVNQASDGRTAATYGLVTKSYGMVYNGTTWDRIRGDLTNGTLVNLGTNNDVDLNAGVATIGSVLPNQYELAGNTTHVKKYYTATTPTNGIVWSPSAGKRWYITDIFINVSEASTVTLEDDLTGGDDPVWKAELYANSGWSHSFTTPLFSGEDAADLIITSSAGDVYVTVTGYEI